MELTNRRTEKDIHSNQYRRGYHGNIFGIHGDRDLLTLNVLLLGERQSGRSSVGNAVIGGEEFGVGMCISGGSETQECRLRCRTFQKFFRRKGEESDMRLRVMDTPPVTHPWEELRRRVYESFPEGVHVVLLVMRADITFHNTHLTQLAQTLLGPQWASHALLVLTHADRLREAGLRQSNYLTQASDSLRALTDTVGGGFLFLDNSSDWPEITGRPLRDKLLVLSAHNKHNALTIKD